MLDGFGRHDFTFAVLCYPSVLFLALKSLPKEFKSGDRRARVFAEVSSKEEA